ncbi:MAG: RluA family pseudouridine synthase, partial [Bdellovibrionales bacterium]|nr:RluA family pseudouridine synthase [Bdellovibrionales bacterium]
MAREHAHTSDDTYLVTWTVEPGEQGQRVDVFLKSKYRRLTRGQIQNSIKEGRVTLNHEPVKPSRILRPGDRVFVVSVRGGEPEVDFNFRVIHEDETILVVDKPGNLPVHPSGRYFFNTLLTQLRVVNRNEVDQRKEFYVVHRVDRETSGVLVLAKTPVAANSLVKQFEGRRTQKEYLAIVKG